MKNHECTLVYPHPTYIPGLKEKTFEHAFHMIENLLSKTQGVANLASG